METRSASEGQFPDLEAAEEVASKTDYSRVLLKAQKNTVGGTKITFTKGDHKVELQAKVSGRFRGFLAPGDYKVTLTAPGRESQELSLNVPVRQHPVWPPIPGVEVEDEDQQTLEIYLK